MNGNAVGEVERQIAVLAARFGPAEAEAIQKNRERLARYVERLLETNQRMNLVSAATATTESLVGTHLFESLLALPLLPAPGKGAARLLDIGSGGGFPAVPLLIVRSDMAGTLVESTGKKTRFLEEVTRDLDLTVETVNARFPASFPMKTRRFDVLTSRAVADAGRLVKGAKPLLRPGATVLLWTTEELAAEAAKRAGIHRFEFHRSPIADKRGIARLVCST